MPVSTIKKDFATSRLPKSPGGKRMTKKELANTAARAQKGRFTRPEKQVLSDEWFTQTVGQGGGIMAPDPSKAPGATSAAHKLFAKLQQEHDLPPPSMIFLA